MDFLDLLDSRHMPYYRKGEIKDKHFSNPDYVQMPCPLCSGNKLFLGYNVVTGYFHCWSCGKANRWELFRAWFHGENVSSLIASITCPKSTYYAPVQHTYHASRSFQIPDGVIALLDSDPHCEYLASRNLDPFVLSVYFGVGAIVSGRLANRIFFPVFDQDRQPVTWQTRTIVPNVKLSYIAADKDKELLPIKSMLYGEYFCSKYETIIVTEGIFDSLRLNCIFDKPVQAVATFGKEVSKEQVTKIGEYPRRIICFDADAQADAKLLAKQLSCFSGITEVVNLDAKDPSTASDKEILRLLKFAGKI
jgi:5S rRNA maturation endonuclease (ribonuclease M5)